MEKLKINNTIRTLRFQNNEMTQAQLAAQCGVTRQTILAIEQSKYTPSLELAFKISNAFQREISDVFSQAKENNNE